MTRIQKRNRRRSFPNVCSCGSRLIYIDTDKWGRVAFEPEPKKVILSEYGKTWVCVPPQGRIVRAIVETGMLVGNTLAYIPHFYVHKEKTKK